MPDLHYIDSKWRKRWVEIDLKMRCGSQRSAEGDSFRVSSSGFYVSHPGLLRSHVICDVLARYMRMEGLYVVHATGWDPFDILEGMSPIAFGIDKPGNDLSPEEKTRVAILQTRKASRVLNGGPGRQRRLRSWEQKWSADSVMSADTVVLDLEDWPIIAWQKMGKIEDSSPTPEYYCRFGVDTIWVAVLFQAPIGETIKWDTRQFASIRNWLGQVWALVRDINLEDSRRKDPLLHCTSRSESAQRLTWIESEVCQGRIDSAVYSEVQRTV